MLSDGILDGDELIELVLWAIGIYLFVKIFAASHGQGVREQQRRMEMDRQTDEFLDRR